MLMCSIHNSIANPILLSGSNLDSGSGNDVDSGSGTIIDSGSETNDDDDHTCHTACKVFTYVVLTILCAAILAFCSFGTLVIYEEMLVGRTRPTTLIKNIIKNCVQSVKINKYCICCMKHRTRNRRRRRERREQRERRNQNNDYIENNYYEKNKETSLYDRFIIIYGIINQNRTPINTECPICLDPIKKDVCILHCNHGYHANCMKKYMNSDNYNKECPLCRKTINI